MFLSENAHRLDFAPCRKRRFVAAPLHARTRKDRPAISNKLNRHSVPNIHRDCQNFRQSFQSISEFAHQADERLDLLRLPRREDRSPNPRASGIYAARHRLALRRDRHLAHATVHDVWFTGHQSRSVAPFQRGLDGGADRSMPARRHGNVSAPGAHPARRRSRSFSERACCDGRGAHAPNRPSH